MLVWASGFRKAIRDGCCKAKEHGPNAGLGCRKVMGLSATGICLCKAKEHGPYAGLGDVSMSCCCPGDESTCCCRGDELTCCCCRGDELTCCCCRGDESTCCCCRGDEIETGDKKARSR